MDKKRVRFTKPLNSKVKKPVDLSRCMSNDLYDRAAKIITVPCAKDDPFEEKKKLRFKDLLMELDPTLVQKLDVGVTEENFADIVEKYQLHKTIDLNIEARIPERKIIQQDINWIHEYMKKSKKE